MNYIVLSCGVRTGGLEETTSGFWVLGNIGIEALSKLGLS